VADLFSWIFHSPRRLALIAVLALGVILAAGSMLVNTSTLAPTGEPAAATTSTAAASAQASSQAAVVPDATPFVTAAVRFVQQWARIKPGESPAQWRARVDPVATPDLAAALELTDPTSLPDAVPSGEPDVRFVSQSSALIAVPLSDGSEVLVTVVNQGQQWRASDVQPDVGDSGLTGSTP